MEEHKDCCLTCGKEIDESHPNMCHACLKGVCAAHSFICSCCYAVVCEHHSEQCGGCQKTLCHAHAVKCRGCGKAKCEECLEEKRCQKCGAPGCSDCLGEACQACSTLRKANQEELEKYQMGFANNGAWEIGFNRESVVLVEYTPLSECRYLLSNSGKVIEQKVKPGLFFGKYMRGNYKKLLLKTIGK